MATWVKLSDRKPKKNQWYQVKDDPNAKSVRQWWNGLGFIYEDDIYTHESFEALWYDESVDDSTPSIPSSIVRRLEEMNPYCGDVDFSEDKRIGYNKAVSKLTELLSAQPSEQDWIKVEEKNYPPFNVGVLVLIPEEDYHVTSGMWDISKKWVLLDEYRIPECEVTHWRYAPKLPDQYEKERQDQGKILRNIKSLTTPSPDNKEEKK